VQFFKTLSPDKLSIQMVGKKGFKINDGVIDLAPNIDGDFLPKSIDELRKDMPKKIVLDGVTEKEGVVFCKSVENLGATELGGPT
jgi:dihydroorotase